MPPTYVYSIAIVGVKRESTCVGVDVRKRRQYGIVGPHRYGINVVDSLGYSAKGACWGG